MNPDNKKFISWDDTITGREARKKYPDPQFFMRPTARMTEAEMRDMLARNITEIRRCLDLIESILTSSANRVPKATLLHHANQLHDWRNSMNMHGGGLGQPLLWEE